MKKKNICIVLLLSYGAILSAMDGSSSTHAASTGAHAGGAVATVAKAELQDGIPATVHEQDALLSEYEKYFAEIKARLGQKKHFSAAEQEYIQRIDEVIKALANTDQRTMRAADNSITRYASSLGVSFRPLLNRLKEAGLFVARTKPVEERPEPSATDAAAQRQNEALAAERARKATLRHMKQQEEQQKRADEERERQAKLDEDARKHQEKQEDQLTEWENGAERFELAWRKANCDSQPLDRDTITSFYVMKGDAFFLSVNEDLAMTGDIFRRAIAVHARFENFLNTPVGAFLLNKASNPLTKPAARVSSVPAAAPRVEPRQQLTNSTGGSIQKPKVPSEAAAGTRVEPRKQPASSTGEPIARPRVPAGRGGRDPKPGRSWWKSVGLIGVGVALLYGTYHVYASLESDDEKKA